MSKPAKTESLLSALEGIMIEQEQQRDLLLRLIRQTAPGHVQLTSEVREALARAARERCSLPIPWLRPSYANGSASAATSRSGQHERQSELARYRPLLKRPAGCRPGWCSGALSHAVRDELGNPRA